jgi:hypothetical protein
MPGPPPGTGVPTGSTCLVVFVGDVAAGAVVIAGAGEGEAVLKPNNPYLGGLGEADTAAVAAGAAIAAGEVSFLACLCLAGLTEAAGLAAGDSDIAAVAAGEASFLACLCLAGVADASALAAGDSAAAVVAAGEASFLACLCLAGVAEASALAAGDSAAAAVAPFLACLCLAGVADAPALGGGVGVWADNETSKNPVRVIIRAADLFMNENYLGGKLVTIPIVARQRRACGLGTSKKLIR